MHTASGKVKCRQFHVSVKLPNLIYFSKLVVSEADLPSNIDCLIGMDLITKGDFSLKITPTGTSEFSFSIDTRDDLVRRAMSNGNVRIDPKTKKQIAQNRKRRRKAAKDAKRRNKKRKK